VVAREEEQGERKGPMRVDEEEEEEEERRAFTIKES